MWKKFYLDTNVYGDLVGNNTEEKRLRSMLVKLVRAGACQVVGSLDILEEFLGLSQRRPADYADGLGLFFDLCQRRVLRPMGDLLSRELAKRDRLSSAEAFLDGNDLHILQGELRHSEQVRNGASEVLVAREKFCGNLEDNAADFEALLQSKGVTKREQRSKMSTFSINAKQIDEWFREGMLLSQEQRRLLESVPGKSPRVGQLPCNRALVSMHLAQVKRRHQLRRKYQVGDLHDWRHYVNAAMAQCLVTSDRALKAAAKEILWMPVPVIGLDDLRRLIRFL